MRILALMSVIAGLATAAPAMQLFHRDTLDGYRAASLAFDPWMCGLWVANETPELILLSLAGTEILRLETPLSNVRAVTADADGLIVTNGRGAFARLGRHGEGMKEAWNRSESQLDVEGLHRHPAGGLLVVGDDSALVQRINDEGAEVFRIEGYALTPIMSEPQGIGLDPMTGNILVVDDFEGLDSLFEFDAEGRFLSLTSLSDWGWDAEAVAVDPQTGTLWIGYDGGTAIAMFDYLPTRTATARVQKTGPDCVIS